jgi:ABC-2 type transport system ATP-binding protein
MRQRLGIARALVNKPVVLFLDEPTLGLDPAGQRDVLQLIGDIARDTGTTVVLSTHLLAEVEAVCSRVVILNKGRIVADGTVDEVTRLVAAPREGRLRVPREAVDATVAALSSLPEYSAVQRNGAADEVLLQLREGVTAEGAATPLVRTLAAHDIPILELTFERARLSDAFLALTAES